MAQTPYSGMQFACFVSSRQKSPAFKVALNEGIEEQMLRPLNAAMHNEVSKHETSLFPYPDSCSMQSFKRSL